ncbi:unnamed protein product [Protopolystoma xenopodis]|uniref:Uncharacterized protein n=1 Tax=Protopolystoma xenopodis TaxID=117903 RepID=A0A3S5BGA7_9PLAT|nr:unnamed protein product [Protopolystoma xenopodis]
MAQPCPSSEVVKSFGDVLTLSEPSFGQAEGQSRDPKVDSCQAQTQTCSVQQPGQTRSSSVGSPWQMVRSEAASPPISTPNLTASYSLSQTSTTTSQACPFGQFPWSNVYHPASNAFPDVNRPFCISPTRIPGIRCLSSRLATLGSCELMVYFIGSVDFPHVLPVIILPMNSLIFHYLMRSAQSLVNAQILE